MLDAAISVSSDGMGASAGWAWVLELRLGRIDAGLTEWEKTAHPPIKEKILVMAIQIWKVAFRCFMADS